MESYRIGKKRVRQDINIFFYIKIEIKKCNIIFSLLNNNDDKVITRVSFKWPIWNYPRGQLKRKLC